MKFILLNCFLLSLCYKEVFNWKIFHNGRSVGGNLGKPGGYKLHRDYRNFERWFTQNLDHFNPGEETTWQQRYYVNDEYFTNGPKNVVFLMIGGEGEATAEWMTKGTWIDYAKEFKALCFQVEHRYYGKSHPTSDLSVKNLQYLTSQQALADLAMFIETMNMQYNLGTNVKWIAFGGSYPGSLAAWLRQKYPHLVHGSMSASGPLLAQVDFQEYFEVVNQDLQNYNPDCLKAVQQGTKQVDVLLKHMVGQRNLNKLFKLCDPVEKSIDNQKDIANLFESLAGNFANVAQYNKDNRIGKNKAGKITIDMLCDIMTNQSIGPQVHRLAEVNSVLLEAYDQKCLDYKYDNMINELRNISWAGEQAEGGRQWTYQTCTEFGFFQSSTYQPQVFGDKFPVDFFIEQCVDIFGPKYNSTFLNAAVNRTNILYGALDIDVSNVVFVHGSVDPWHALGITKARSPNAPAIYIEGTAHCANMYPASDKDLPQLTAARLKIKQYIKSWLE
ncbi:putative serine protease K12H4.7 [Aethina tumida]|uniref:putative serine protease K12H4.7 n=1 Tax=Aethina tumida TaxID=116153 RepID=UPI00096B067E|nr:putative serine protease K12H4.7 [Aethina tumida]